jgi:beta-glucosidase-like glycosyl hydrolase
MVDISVEPRWGRVCEGAGEDPFLGSKIAEAQVHGFQGKDLSDTLTVLACVKHFAAYGAPLPDAIIVQLICPIEISKKFIYHLIKPLLMLVH